MRPASRSRSPSLFCAIGSAAPWVVDEAKVAWTSTQLSKNRARRRALATPSPDDHGPHPDGGESAWHALLHDLRGCLGGVKATLDLRDAGAGLEARDAAR